MSGLVQRGHQTSGRASDWRLVSFAATCYAVPSMRCHGDLGTGVLNIRTNLAGIDDKVVISAVAFGDQYRPMLFQSAVGSKK